jgi:hypothetical protein
MVDNDKDIENISEEQKNKLLEDLKAYRELKQTGSRASSLSVAQDVRQTMQRITIEVSVLRRREDQFLTLAQLQHLHLRTGSCSVLFVSKSHIDDQTIPGWVATGESASFFLDVLKVDVWDVLRKYEQWVCSKDQSESTALLCFCRLYVTLF